MSDPLAPKGRDANAAEPAFDPGAASASADAEAAGAPRQAPEGRASNIPPDGNRDPSSPARPGVKLPPVFWVAAAGVLLLALILAGMASF
ncbi:hypothetical protein [Phenylobacterium sp.]|uniref:hypothetical protein n=1 Tax=Phenylobacterium sp. TaxID=1871053 RepID=UPI0008BFBAEE|nr:hypothetical protein [Phenylobacterium sp.]MBA4793783.1 hypothetical protein [Phenylobacterium sp.]OHB36956.1 MAG: hypothetical protein A2882_02810 [Phenylobacterium sp. RIFCSPHIGHO2_01_FULL_70_10]